jgi:hypothetical protein
MCDLHLALKILYVYDFITELYRQKAKLIQKHENANILKTGQGGA